MSYQLYLLKQGSAPSPLFKSHWALFVLIHGDFAQGTADGTSIHVTGSLFAGFTFEVKRNWGQAIMDQVFRSILIGEVPEASVALPESTSPITNFMLDSEAKSPLELALLTQPAPGKSLRVSVFLVIIISSFRDGSDGFCRVLARAVPWN